MMERTCRQIQLRTFGVPDAVAELVESTVPAPQAKEIMVNMLFAPVNPADLNLIQGTYGIRPDLPAVAGTEGVGRVVETGEGVTAVTVGDLVIVVNRIGCWSTLLLLGPGEFVKIPPAVDLQQASMLKINPLTAWCLLHKIVALRPGDFVLQNAANSGVGIAAAQLAERSGLQMIHFLRSEEAAAQVRSLSGADHVFLDSREGAEAAREVLGEGGARLALNAVGGESALRLMALLGKDGTHVTYGAMSGSSLKVPNSFLIFRNLCLRGFWVTEWMKSQSRQQLEKVYEELADLLLAGTLRAPVDTVYPLSEIGEALRHAAQPSRRGKILLQIDVSLTSASRQPDSDRRPPNESRS